MTTWKQKTTRLYHTRLADSSDIEVFQSTVQVIEKQIKDKNLSKYIYKSNGGYRIVYWASDLLPFSFYRLSTNDNTIVARSKSTQKLTRYFVKIESNGNVLTKPADELIKCGGVVVYFDIHATFSYRHGFSGHRENTPTGRLGYRILAVPASMRAHTPQGALYIQPKTLFDLIRSITSVLEYPSSGLTYEELMEAFNRFWEPINLYTLLKDTGRQTQGEDDGLQDCAHSKSEWEAETVGNS